MKRVLPAVTIVAFIILPQAAQAQFYDEKQLAKVEEIHVLVEDSVKGGCLPSPSVLKVEAELILRRSGITVTDRDLSPAYTLTITAVGFALPDVRGCTGSISVELWRFEKLSDQTLGLVEVAQSAGIYAGPKDGFQEQLRNVVNRKATALANEILKARQETRRVIRFDKEGNRIP